MLQSDSQGRIAFYEVLEAVNGNSADIANNITAIVANTQDIESNKTILADHETRITNIENSAGTLPALEARVTQNEADITSNKTSIHNIETDVSNLEVFVNDNRQGIASNKANITANANDIVSINTTITDMQTDIINVESKASTNESDILIINNTIATTNTRIGTIEADVTSIEGRTASLETRMTDAESDIASIDTRTTELESGSNRTLRQADTITDVDVSSLIVTQNDMLSEVDKLAKGDIDVIDNRLMTEEDVYQAVRQENYLIIEHKEASGTNGGTATTGSWEERTLNTIVENYIDATLNTNIITLKKGKYLIEGTIVGSGLYQQARLYNITRSTELCYSTSNDGTVFINSVITIVDDDEQVKLESQVDTTVTDVGYGEANAFGDGIFIQLKLTKTGV